LAETEDFRRLHGEYTSCMLSTQMLNHYGRHIEELHGSDQWIYGFVVGIRQEVDEPRHDYVHCNLFNNEADFVVFLCQLAVVITAMGFWVSSG
jgi:hypothetical protein